MLSEIIAGAVTGIIAVLYYIVRNAESEQNDTTYFGNQDKLVRNISGSTQVTYKGR